jgi:long-chain acyl-CoA synthetase
LSFPAHSSWWILSDLAIWFAGHVTVPVYPTLTADTVQYIIEHSESKLVFIGKLDDHPWSEMKNGVPKEMPTVSFPISPGEDHDGGKHEKWDDLIKKFEPIKEIVTRTPDEMATIIYTR